MMEMLTKEIHKKCVTISICAIKKEETFFNVFTLVRDRLNLETYSWRKRGPGKKKIKFFNACFLREEAEKIIEQLTSGYSFSLQVGQQFFEIKFGNLKQRTPVFMPNDIGNSVANDWWPGTLKSGFSLTQWFCSEKADILLKEKTVERIKEYMGMQIDKLSDLRYGIVRLKSIESFSAEVSYNPDKQNVFFYLKGDIPLIQFRLVLLLHEGEEAIYKKIVDLPANIHSYCMKSPFNPTSLGYELYQLCEDDTWQLIASKLGTILSGVSIEIGVIQGKLKVINEDKEEDYNIVSHEIPVVVDDTREDIEQPWIHAELNRNKRNRAIELEEYGSIFMPSDGSESHQKLMKIIDEKIIKPEKEFIYVWDPYLDGSILRNFVVQAIRYPSMKIRMILSEYDPEFGNCKFLNEEFQRISDGRANNLQIRNWYRSGKQAFHDRFIITSHGVWQLGSSLKDIGNYHTTIYRLDGNLPAQVEAEFKRAWEGDFHNKKPSGFQVIPFAAEERG